MANQHQPPAMSQKIFNLSLPTETISAYLMCCGLNDVGSPLTIANMLEIWNGSETSLREGLRALEKLKIVKKIISDRHNQDIYILTSTEDWMDG